MVVMAIAHSSKFHAMCPFGLAPPALCSCRPQCPLWTLGWGRPLPTGLPTTRPLFVCCRCPPTACCPCPRTGRLCCGTSAAPAQGSPFNPHPRGCPPSPQCTTGRRRAPGAPWVGVCRCPHPLLPVGGPELLQGLDFRPPSRGVARRRAGPLLGPYLGRLPVVVPALWRGLGWASARTSPPPCFPPVCARP